MNSLRDIGTRLNLNLEQVQVATYEVVAYRFRKETPVGNIFCCELKMKITFTNGSIFEDYVTKDFVVNEPQFWNKSLSFIQNYLLSHKGNKSLTQLRNHLLLLINPDGVINNADIQANPCQGSVNLNQLPSQRLNKRENQIQLAASNSMRSQLLQDMFYAAFQTADRLHRENPSSIFSFNNQVEVQRAQLLQLGSKRNHRQVGGQSFSNPQLNSFQAQQQIQQNENEQEQQNPVEMIQPRINQNIGQQNPIQNLIEENIPNLNENLDQNPREQIIDLDPENEIGNQQNREAEGIPEIQDNDSRRRAIEELEVEIINPVREPGERQSLSQGARERSSSRNRRNRVFNQGNCDNCCVCLQPLLNGEPTSALEPCMHVLHANCKIQLLESNLDTCPICRSFLYLAQY